MTQYERDLDLRAEAIEFSATAQRQRVFDEGVRWGRELERREHRHATRSSLAEAILLLLAGPVTGAVLTLGFVEIYGAKRLLR